MNDQNFGDNCLPAWADRLAQLCRQLPDNWLGRRLAFALRKAVLKAAGDCVDCTIDGINLRLYPRGNLSDKRLLCTPAMLDGPERRFLAEHLSPDSCLIDAGANIGGYSLLLAGVRPDLHFLAIEADARLSERLQANVTFSHMASRIRIATCAVTEQDGPVTLWRDDVNAGKNRIALPESANPQAAQQEIPGYALLSLLDQHAIDRPGAFKLDIEGHELPVLRGFFSAAPEPRWPDYIQLEQPRGPLCSEVIDLLQDHGYRPCLRTRMNVICARHPED